VSILAYKRGVRGDSTHPTGGSKFENLLVEGMKVDPFAANIQCSLVDRKLLRRTEVSI